MAAILDLFVPREKKFFELLARQIDLLEDCSKRLLAVAGRSKKTNKIAQRDLFFIQKKKDEADAISNEIISSLHQTFITPIDREEIRSLAVSTNMIIHSIEKIAMSILYFNVKKLNRIFLKQIEILAESIAALKFMFVEPLSLKQNRSYIEKIKDFEREADVIFMEATVDLFNNGHNPIEVIKQRELYQITEDAVDYTKHIADLMETVLINNA